MYFPGRSVDLGPGGGCVIPGQVLLSDAGAVTVVTGGGLEGAGTGIAFPLVLWGSFSLLRFVFVAWTPCGCVKVEWSTQNAVMTIIFIVICQTKIGHGSQKQSDYDDFRYDKGLLPVRSFLSCQYRNPIVRKGTRRGYRRPRKPHPVTTSKSFAGRYIAYSRFSWQKDSTGRLML